MKVKNPYQRRGGFTLVELLVVISIIAILATASFPAMNAVLTNARMNASMQNAVNIHKGLVNYASGSSGLYPDGNTANEALGYLVDDLTSEKPFYVSGDPWHGQTFAKGPDNLWEFSSPSGTALEAGENAYAFSVGMSPESDARLPLIASGFTEGGVGTYTNDQTKPGGRWKGKKCVIVYADGKGDTPELDRKSFKLMENGYDVFGQDGVDFKNPVKGN
ncbi:MAG: type II secretion system protein [Verrucomicrobiota bacterium]